MNPAHDTAAYDSPGTYFFLSYAHVAPPTATPDRDPSVRPQPEPDPDHWVRVFYEELHAEVRRLARPNSHLDIGFFDPQLPPGTDWAWLLAGALSAAEVFVPLYSPTYLDRSWPIRERDSFRRRLAMTPGARTQDHIQPVLWIPFPTPVEESEVSRELGAGIPEYAENGLRAMRMLAEYRELYWDIVKRLARRIVDVAEQTPLGPSPIAQLSAIETTSAETPFVVAVIAPTEERLPGERSGTGYGQHAVQWRPFTGATTLPIAEYAANAAERLGLPSRTVDFRSRGSLLETAPGLLLIDPWVIAQRSGRGVIARAVDRLREWVVPIVVADTADPQYAERGAALADDVVRMLSAEKHRERAVRRVRGAEEFDQMLPTLVTLSRRLFLRHAKVRLPTPGKVTDE